MAKGLDSQFARARSAEVRGDFPAAADIYYRIIALYPSNVRAQRALSAMKQRISDRAGGSLTTEFQALFAIYAEGRLEEVLARVEALLAAGHGGQPAIHNLAGAALLGLGRPEEAETAFRRAISLEPSVGDGWNNLGNALRDQKRFDEARLAYETAIQRRQDYPEAWSNLGAALQELGHVDEALSACGTALVLNPNLLDAINNRGTALIAKGKPVEAEADFRRALEMAPGNADLHNNLGEALIQQERFAEAAASYRRAVDLKPDYADAWNNLGVALRKTGDTQAALEAYELAMQLSPEMAALRRERGNMLLDRGDDEDAAAEYAAAIQRDPNDKVALNNLGAILLRHGYLARALQMFDRVLELDPEYLDAQVNRGATLREMGWIKEAEEELSTAAGVHPKVAVLWSNLAFARQELGQYEGAIEAYTRALELEPSLSEARMHRLYLRAQICDWSIHSSLDSELTLTETGRDLPAAFPALAMRDDPAFQQRRAAAMASRWKDQPSDYQAPAASADGRIRIGYFSGDYHDHAIMFLASGLFREHDKNRFEIFCYSSGQVRQGTMRERVMADAEHFHDVLELSDSELTELARSHKLDIAIDVSGYTKGSRTGTLARRVAPVQINYLGYPGTMGADFIDYIVVDPVLVPADEREHVSERLIVLPGAYQPNDNTRVIAEAPTTRADFGLPEDAFVFCCFNQGFKITPREWAIWMRLLAGVPNSVLWLMVSNRTARENLLREAAARGIGPERLVFAEGRHHSEHLARHRHADLFLDTFAYNAHTTMSDALWAGLPAVTRLGRQFAARVGASLLANVGLPELIAESDEAYEELALALATDPRKLEAIRAKLAKNLPSAPLFDTLGYTRAIEAGYCLALERSRQGLAPEDIVVPAA